MQICLHGRMFKIHAHTTDAHPMEASSAVMSTEQGQQPPATASRASLALVPPSDPATVVRSLGAAVADGSIEQADAYRYLDALREGWGIDNALRWAAHFVAAHPEWHDVRHLLGTLMLAAGDVGGQVHVEYALAQGSSAARAAVQPATAAHAAVAAAVADHDVARADTFAADVATPEWTPRRLVFPVSLLLVGAVLMVAANQGESIVHYQDPGALKHKAKLAASAAADGETNAADPATEPAAVDPTTAVDPTSTADPASPELGTTEPTATTPVDPAVTDPATVAGVTPATPADPDALANAAAAALR